VPRSPFIVERSGRHHAVVNEADYFGAPSYDLAHLPDRLSGPANRGAKLRMETGVDARRVTAVQSPAESLAAGDDSSWLAKSRAAQRKLAAAFLVAEDPQSRLEARAAASLLHQLSLVKHILTSANLKSVLIADEVGLGKTVEAGFIISHELERRPQQRVLYLAPARLVANVVSELRAKFGLDARRWSASDTDARLDSDQLVVGSIQKAVHPSNFKTFCSSGPWDMLVVDECHHLSDWGLEGGKPNQGYRLVRDIIQDHMPEDSRVVLMSGTPHQGHEARFKNILKLLSRKDDPTEIPSGRVIYRVKDKILDWERQAYAHHSARRHWSRVHRLVRRHRGPL
jgi:SNF2 family DNA or RNA helicase